MNSDQAMVDRASAGLAQGKVVMVRCSGERSVLEALGISRDEETCLVTVVGRRGEEIVLAPGQLAEVRVMPAHQAA